RALIVNVPLAGNGTDSASDAALLTLRNRALPATLGRVGGIRHPGARDTASSYDDPRPNDAAHPPAFPVAAPPALGAARAAFRSVTLPLVSIGLNLLSVGAAYGLITLIFQDGRLQGLVGYTSFGGIIYWIPLFMFVLVFGLSMDYHVFILSRIRELRLRGMSTRDAVVGGIATSAGVLTSAAVIMVAVLSIFAALHLVELKMRRIGLSAAVLIDATLVRGLLVPA